MYCDKEFVSEGIHKDVRNGVICSVSTLCVQNIYCPHCYKAHYSKKEKEVLEYVKSIYHDDIIENDRIQLEGKELDIYLPKLNLGVEFNGDFWHSSEEAKQRDTEKKAICESKGICLFVITEKEWDNNQEKIKETLKNLLISLTNQR